MQAQRDMMAKACARNLFAKAAKRQVRVPEDLAQQVEALALRRCLDLLGLARRAGAVVAGRPSTGPLQETAGQPVVVIRVTAERFSFTPSQIKVATGTIVEIVAESEDTTHGFHLADAGIDEQIPARGKGELRLRFEATQAIPMIACRQLS